MWAIIARGDRSGAAAATPYQTAGSQIEFRKSTNGGRSWSGTPYANLNSAMVLTSAAIVWDMAIAPDDANIAIVAVSKAVAGSELVQQVWITTDGGANWDNTQWTGYATTLD